MKINRFADMAPITNHKVTYALIDVFDERGYSSYLISHPKDLIGEKLTLKALQVIKSFFVLNFVELVSISPISDSEVQSLSLSLIEFELP